MVRIVETTGDFVRIVEFNQNHDARGKFSSGQGGAAVDEFAFEPEVPGQTGVVTTPTGTHEAPGFTQAEVNAIATWQTSHDGCWTMRKRAEDGKAPEFESAVDKCPPVKGIVFRGVDDNDKNGYLDLASEQKLWEGRVGSDIKMSWASTSPDRATASQFGHVILAMDGADAHDIRGIAPWPHFPEAIAKPATYRVKSVYHSPASAGKDASVTVRLEAL